MSSVIEAAAPTSESWTITDLTLIRVAIAGCGVVGTALVRELARRQGALASRHGVAIAVQRVLVRDITKQRDAALDSRLLTDDVEEFLNTDADVVIEAIGGLDPALRIAQRALERGRDFITANKLLLALHGRSRTDRVDCLRRGTGYDSHPHEFVAFRRITLRRARGAIWIAREADRRMYRGR